MERMGETEAFDSLLDRLMEYLGEAERALARSAPGPDSPVKLVRTSRDLVEILRSRVHREIGRLAPMLDPDLTAYLIRADGPEDPTPIRREVTVLFVDLHGFSELCERTPLEALVPLLNRYLELAWACIRAEGGVVDRFMGDAVLGWFNAPFELPDHPYRALRAAWRMQQEVLHLHAALPPEHRRRYRIGVHLGEAVLGPIGTREFQTYTLVGSTVNYARRLQEAAPPGQIMISRAVFERVRDRIEARALPIFPVRGGAQVVPVYRFLGFREETP
jgi:class 3 adenylate cyclase